LSGITLFQLASFHRLQAGQNRGFDSTQPLPFAAPAQVLEDEEFE